MNAAMKRRAVIGIAVCWAVASAQAALITFDLLGDAAIYNVLDDKASGSVVVDGVTATLTASHGVLNRTGSGFGVNDLSTSSDDTDALNANQWIDVEFDQAVIFTNLNVSSWGTNDTGEVRLAPTFASQGGIAGTGDTEYYFHVDPEQTVRFFAASDTGEANGFSVDSFTVEAIPEPAAIGFVSLVGIGALVIKRFV